MLPRGTKRWNRPERLPFQWAIEGDIKGCFDHIRHHALMQRVRRRIGDGKLNRLILAFLKAGALSEAGFTRTDSGTPQGGVLSPLLANIALSVIEERYERYVWPRQGTASSGRGRSTEALTDPAAIARRAARNRASDRARTVPVFMPIRYADDFIILVASPHDDPEKSQALAQQEKSTLGKVLEETLDLTLSPEKTLQSRLKRLNPILRSWGNFYRHAWGAKRVFTAIDHYVW